MIKKDLVAGADYAILRGGVERENLEQHTRATCVSLACPAITRPAAGSNGTVTLPAVQMRLADGKVTAVPVSDVMSTWDSRVERLHVVGALTSLSERLTGDDRKELTDAAAQFRRHDMPFHLYCPSRHEQLWQLIVRAPGATFQRFNASAVLGSIDDALNLVADLHARWHDVCAIEMSTEDELGVKVRFWARDDVDLLPCHEILPAIDQVVSLPHGRRSGMIFADSHGLMALAADPARRPGPLSCGTGALAELVT